MRAEAQAFAINAPTDGGKDIHFALQM